MPDNISLTSPGEYIRNLLLEKDKSWTQDELAQILSLSKKHVNEILKDKRPLSYEIISDISSAFELSATEKESFAQLNTQFRLKQLEKNLEVENKAKLFDLLPVGEMLKKGWLNKSGDFKNLLADISKAFGFDSKNIQDLKNIIERKKLDISYRNSDNEKFTPLLNNRVAWYLYAKNQANQIKNIHEYDKSKLILLFKDLSNYTNYKNRTVGISNFLKRLNEAGVRFLFLSHLSKTYTEGAAFDCEHGPVVALTGRTNRIDTFWFNMAHEIYHILEKHYEEGGAMIDVEESFSKNNKDPKEIEANEAASKTLKSIEISTHFKKYYSYIPENEVLNFSIEHNIHPSIIVGRLAYEGIASWTIVHRFKETVKDLIPPKYIFDKF